MKIDMTSLFIYESVEDYKPKNKETITKIYSFRNSAGQLLKTPFSRELNFEPNQKVAITYELWDSNRSGTYKTYWRLKDIQTMEEIKQTSKRES